MSVVRRFLEETTEVDPLSTIPYGELVFLLLVWCDDLQLERPNIRRAMMEFFVMGRDSRAVIGRRWRIAPEIFMEVTRDEVPEIVVPCMSPWQLN